MTMKYRAATDTVTGQMAIFACPAESPLFNRHSEFPVAILSAQGSGFPLDKKELAENMADLLNHLKPRHTLVAQGHEIFYTPRETGLILKTRPVGDDSGVSVAAVTMVISDKNSVTDYARDMLARMNPDFMKKVCDTITPDPAVAAKLQQTGTSGQAFRP